MHGVGFVVEGRLRRGVVGEAALLVQLKDHILVRGLLWGVYHDVVIVIKSGLILSIAWWVSDRICVIILGILTIRYTYEFGSKRVISIFSGCHSL